MPAIKINGSETNIAQDTSIMELLKTVNRSDKGIAVAVNQKVVSKQNWGNTFLQANDDILIIEATQGG